MSQRPVDLWPDWEISPALAPGGGPGEPGGPARGPRRRRAMVGSALTLEPLKDNAHLGALEVYVAARAPAPGRRQRVAGARRGDRRGGRADDAARRRTRRRSTEDGADRRWAEARGYAVANDRRGEGRRPGRDRRPAAGAGGAGRGAAGRLPAGSGWTDPAPEEHLASLAAALSRFVEEIPLGDLDLRPQAWTPERLRGAGGPPSGAAPRASSPSSRSPRPARWPASPTSPCRRTRRGWPTSAARWCCRATGATASASRRQGAAPPAGPGAAPGCGADRDRQRDDQPLDERRQRAARLPAGRPDASSCRSCFGGHLSRARQIFRVSARLGIRAYQVVRHRLLGGRGPAGRW